MLEERFWSKVDRSGGSDSCWLWIGNSRQKGYGAFHLPGRIMVRAHRYSYELAHGRITGGLDVLHRCDVRLCVNPSHLFLGTAADNIHDCAAKGRFNHAGEHNAAARLTRVQALEIRLRRARGESGTALAVEYGVHRNTIYAISRGEHWADAS